MPPALPPWPAPDAPAAAPAPTTRAPAAPPSRAGPPPRRAPAPPPSTPRPCDWSTARRPPAAPPAGAAACRAAPASGSSLSSRCAVAGRRARPDRRRCTAPAASRPTAPRTQSSRPPRPPRGPSPAARSPGRAGPSGCPPRRGTAPPAPPRSSVPPPPPRVRLPQAKAQPTGCVTPQEPSPNTSAGNRMTRPGLTVNEAKTRLTRLPTESFDFLGYTVGRFSGKGGVPYIGPHPSRKAVRRLMQRIHEAPRSRWHSTSPAERVAVINRLLRGWTAYFNQGPVLRTYGLVRRYVERRVRRWLMRRSGRRGTGDRRYPDEHLYGVLGLFPLPLHRGDLPSAKA